MKFLPTVLLLIGAGAALADPLRDPMRPPGAVAPGPATAAGTPPAVSAVFISPTRRVAVVDGRIVRAGDRVGGCLVEEVLAEGVRCRAGALLPGPRGAAPQVAFRTPVSPPTVAANGDKK